MKRVASMAAVLALSGAALAQTPRPPGYLSEQTAPDTYRILPPAPVAGSTRYEADRTVFLSTRKFEGTPRWALAAADADLRTMPKHMSCALGVELTAQNAPRLMSLVGRMGRDLSRGVNHPKDIYKRQRPYLIDEGPICIPKTPELASNADYPSGHTTWGWAWGLILAELAPDRATEILIRAKAFGESRLVCGVHNLSAVEAGRANASIVVAALHGDPTFRKDLEAARREVAKARAAGPAPDPQACAKEAELIAASPY